MLFLGLSLWVNRDSPPCSCPAPFPLPTRLLLVVRGQFSISWSPWYVRLREIPLSHPLLALPSVLPQIPAFPLECAPRLDPTRRVRSRPPEAYILVERGASASPRALER